MQFNLWMLTAARDSDLWIFIGGFILLLFFALFHGAEFEIFSCLTSIKRGMLQKIKGAQF